MLSSRFDDFAAFRQSLPLSRFRCYDAAMRAITPVRYASLPSPRYYAILSRFSDCFIFDDMLQWHHELAASCYAISMIAMPRCYICFLRRQRCHCGMLMIDSQPPLRIYAITLFFFFFATMIIDICRHITLAAFVVFHCFFAASAYDTLMLSALFLLAYYLRHYSLRSPPLRFFCFYASLLPPMLLIRPRALCRHCFDAAADSAIAAAILFADAGHAYDISLLFALCARFTRAASAAPF